MRCIIFSGALYLAVHYISKLHANLNRSLNQVYYENGHESVKCTVVCRPQVHKISTILCSLLSSGLHNMVPTVRVACTFLERYGTVPY